MITRFTDNAGAEWSFDELARIGDGGATGEVFAGSGADGTAVAVKRVRLLHRAEKHERQRGREVEIVERLVQAARSGGDTGNLVLPIGYCFRDDDLLIVMPLAEESLAKALTRGAFGIDAGVDAVRQVALGLVQLAALSIAHRDLKPANVLRFGTTWKITDFGLSRDLAEATGTYTLAGLGTVPYMAPELWENPLSWSAKTDLYALGVLAFEVLMGSRPFNGPLERDFKRQHLHEAPPALTGVPSRIGRLVVRLLQKEPVHRHQDARAVCEVLDRYVEGVRREQDPLVDAAYAAERRLLEEQAAGSATEADVARKADLRRQASSDLDDVLADAYDDLLEALPDLRIDNAAREVVIGGLRIVFETREPLHLSDRDDDRKAVLLGVVRRGSVQRSAATVYANLSYGQREDGRLGWTFTWPDPLEFERRPLDAAAVLDIVRSAAEKYAGI
ncbi:serine/threonine-protein kinase [Lentzea kentuckyensis]|uniref:serine/threonine-protein kinase n=1 Tax=Lentzea kentuckyensis TaxID=360086 RepID=UPI000A3D47FB|nr:serine/threonine-protein kinase [Lentzea kentuckyensis]